MKRFSSRQTADARHRTGLFRRLRPDKLTVGSHLISANRGTSAGPISTTARRGSPCQEGGGDKGRNERFLENVSEGPDSERCDDRSNWRASGTSLSSPRFTTSFGYMEPTLKVAKKYPNVHFEHGHATCYKRDKHVLAYPSASIGPLQTSRHHRRQDVEGPACSAISPRSRFRK